MRLVENTARRFGIAVEENGFLHLALKIIKEAGNLEINTLKLPVDQKPFHFLKDNLSS
ncbi:hypothetical protein GCM10008086_13000 [Salegentibacter mishustinae]|nr:hypothetical protein GCM10008086_13000 [Salegentibacter mishustinae]